MLNVESQRILIVEDEDLISRILTRMLEKAGYTIVGQAVNGWQGVQLVQEKEPDVVLMDLEMPDMDGITACQRIYQYCPTPIVILTGHPESELVEQAGQAGAGAYLLKPPTLEEVERAITIATIRFNDMIKLRQLNDQLSERNRELEAALKTVKQLSGLLPICASCKRIRDEVGQWEELEYYIHQHSNASFSHGICPDCAVTFYSNPKADDETRTTNDKLNKE
jgi:CheY-like chemotaxis protein